MNGTEAISKILTDLTDSYQMLWDLLQRERKSLHEMDSTAVEEVSRHKDTILMRIRLLEEERLRLTAAFIRMHSLVGRPNELNLRRIIEVTGDATLETKRETLIGVIQRCSELNTINKALIERSLRYISNSNKFFATLGPSPSASGMRTGTLVSRET